MEHALSPIFVYILLATVASRICLVETALLRKAGSKDDFVGIHVPEYVQEGRTVYLRCMYDVDTDKLYSMKWYKGAQEFFRFTPKESPSIRVFPAFGGKVDLSLSNISHVALVNLNLNLTDKYTCEVTKDFPDYTTSMKTSKMTVVAFPENNKPLISTTQTSASIGDTLKANCTSLRSKPIASIVWLLNELPVSPHYLSSPIIFRDEDSKETITVGLSFTVRQQDFVRGRLTLTCHAKIHPDLYNSSANVVILEHDRPKLSSVVDNHSSSLPSNKREKSGNRHVASSGLRSIYMTTTQALSLPLLLHLRVLFVFSFVN